MEMAWSFNRNNETVPAEETGRAPCIVQRRKSSCPTPPCSELGSDEDLALDEDEDEKDCVVLTLATRFLASHILQALLMNDYHVKAMITCMDSQKDIQCLFEIQSNAHKRLVVHEVNPFKEESWAKLLTNAKYVIHVVTPLSESRSGSIVDEEEMVSPTVKVTECFMDACLASRVQRIIMVSSITTIAISKQKANSKKVYTEKDWENVKDVQGHGKSLLLSEKVAWEKIEKQKDSPHKVELVVLNPAFIMGPIIQGKFSHSMSIIQDIMESRMTAIPRINIPIVDARDVSAAVINALTNPDVVNKRHILWGQSVWVSEIAKILRKEFNTQGFSIRTEKSTKNKTGGSCLQRMLCRAKSTGQERLRFRENSVFLFDNSRMVNVLKVIPRDKEETFLETAYSLIHYNMVSK